MIPEPNAVIIAGPNGSGKSTLTARLRRATRPANAFPPSYINADEIAVGLRASGVPDPEYAAFLEGRRLRQVYREERRSHAYETVLSHPSGILDLIALREAGFHVRLMIVTTEDPSINVERVRGRVLTGGHDVPADRIVARYHRCMHLPRAIEVVHESRVFDSTNHLRLVMSCRNGESSRLERLPTYLTDKLVEPLRGRSLERLEMAKIDQLDFAYEMSGEYEGSVAWLGKHYLVQNCPDLRQVAHDLCMVAGNFEMGQSVPISYREGAGTILAG